MHKFLLDLPTRLEAERVYLRRYEPGDGPMYYQVSQKNQPHLDRYERENALMSVSSVEDAEILVRRLNVAWVARNSFFMGVFDKSNDQFVAQIYIGPVNWDLPEFDLGYFADRDHEGQGYVTEAARAALGFIFNRLEAQRVSLECDDTNLRSQHVAERCGFSLEGHIRRNKRNPDGTLTGTMHYGLLREEFEKDRRKNEREMG